MSDLFFLQDSRSNVGSRAMFWREGGGYTSNLNEAEQFNRELAVKQYECRETDLPWPVEYVRTRAEVGVDCQYLTKSEAEAYRNEDGRVYVAYAREWDGNDLVWRGGGGPTGNLEDAIHPGAADAAEYLAQGFELWPCGYRRAFTAGGPGCAARPQAGNALRHPQASQAQAPAQPHLQRPTQLRRLRAFPQRAPALR